MRPDDRKTAGSPEHETQTGPARIYVSSLPVVSERRRNLLNDNLKEEKDQEDKKKGDRIYQEKAGSVIPQAAMKKPAR